MPVSKKHVSIGCLLIAVGSILLIIGIAGHYKLQGFINDGILEADVVTSKSSKNYPKWVRNDFDGAPALYQQFTMYNLTNPWDAQYNGATPQYEEIGPFVYREFHQKLNVSWNDDQTQVSFLDYAHFTFEPSLSVGDPTKAVITNLNPAYMGVINQASSDLLFSIGFTGVVLADYLQFLTSDFIDYMRLNYSSDQVLPMTSNYLITSTNASYFYEMWANGTSVPNNSSQWKGMLISEISQNSSGISISACESLFDPLFDKSLLNTSYSSIVTWQNCLYGDLNSIIEIQSLFTLSSFQLNMILIWLNGTFYQNQVDPYILNQWGISDIRDMGWIQWGQATVTSGVSVQALFPQDFITVPEFPIWFKKEGVQQNLPTLSLNSSKALLNGTFGLFNPTNVAIFTAQLAAQNWTFIQQTWLINATEAVDFLAYFLGQARNASIPTLEEIFAEGGGLITNRTVHEMLWNVTDPLLAILKPNLANARLSVNFSSEEDVYQNQNLSICFTGKGDTTKIMWFIQENGMNVITGFSQNITIEGTNSDGQFQPFMNSFTKLYTWNDPYSRLITLVPTGTSSIHGVELMNYMVDNSTWNQNSQYTNDFEGFVNLSAVKKAPVFMGNPHMFMADESWTKKINGMLPQNATRDQTVAGIEPNTGKAMTVSKVLQLNLLIPEYSAMYSFFNLKISTGVMYPIMWVHQTGDVTPGLAKQLRNSLIRMITFKSYLLPVFIPFGSFFLLVGLVIMIPMGFLGYRFSKQSPAYVEIRDG